MGSSFINTLKSLILRDYAETNPLFNRVVFTMWKTEERALLSSCAKIPLDGNMGKSQFRGTLTLLSPVCTVCS